MKKDRIRKNTFFVKKKKEKEREKNYILKRE